MKEVFEEKGYGTKQIKKLHTQEKNNPKHCAYPEVNISMIG